MYETGQYCELIHAQLGVSNSYFEYSRTLLRWTSLRLKMYSSSTLHPDYPDVFILLRASCMCLTLEINEFRCSGVWLRYFSTNCAVRIENSEGWWSSSCCGLVAEHWRLKPEVSWVWLLVTVSLFTFLYFCLKTSNFIYCLHISMRMIYVWDLGQCLDPRSFIQRCHLKSV